MTFLETYLLTYGVIVLFMIAQWLVSVLIRNASIVDVFWGMGYVIAALCYYFWSDGFQTRQVIVLALVTIWGLRLTWHIGRRNFGKGEDYRYQNFRKHYGPGYWWISFFQVFLLQGTLLWFVSMPVLAAQFHETPAYLTLLDVFGMFLWAVGFFFEAVGDWQLARFKANPDNKGKVLDTGLWRYTRHPNYFGDALLWWGLYCIAVATPGGFLTILSPVVMTFLLLRVSGVAMLERSLKKSKPEYAEYIRRTSAFIPMPPKD